jgi:ZIP family zinc transporter
MTESLLWGFVAASSLLIGALISIRWTLPKQLVGIIMAFGVGVLISAIAFELAEEAFQTAGASVSLAVGLIAGALTFFVGNTLINRMGGKFRKRLEGNPEGTPLAIVLGTVLDGIPESIVIGLSILHGGSVGVAMLAAVFLSNLPESIGATSGMRKNGWKTWPLLGMWTFVVVISGLASLAGYSLFSNASPDTLAFMLAFSAGALLTMLADTMMPEAYKDTGQLAGLVTTFGFGIAFWISMFE